MKEDLQEILNRVRRISYEYEAVRLILVFLGGAISIPISQYLGTEILKTMPNIITAQQNSTNIQSQLQTVVDLGQRFALENQLSTFQQSFIISLLTAIVLSTMLYFVPIILSVFFTKLSSEKRIVPPLYMQIVLLSYSIIYYVHNPDRLTQNEQANIVSLIGIYTLFAGITQNSFATWIIGLNPTDKDIQNRFSIRVYAPLDIIENILIRKEWKEGLYLRNEIETTRRGIEFRATEKSDYPIIIELQRVSNDETIINMVIFDKGSYYFKTSSKLDSFAMKQFLYLKYILANDDASVRFEVISSNNCEHIVENLKDRSKGAYAHLEEISKETAFRIIMFSIALLLIGGLFVWSKDTTNAMLSIITVVLYLAFELTRLSRKRIKQTTFQGKCSP